MTDKRDMASKGEQAMAAKKKTQMEEFKARRDALEAAQALERGREIERAFEKLGRSPADEGIAAAQADRAAAIENFHPVCSECPQHGAGFPIELYVTTTDMSCPNCGRRWGLENY
jgi:hypothetical protein